MENNYAGVFTWQVEEDALTAFPPPDSPGKARSATKVAEATVAALGQYNKQ